MKFDHPTMIENNYSKIETVILDIFFREDLLSLESINSEIYNSLYSVNKQKSSGSYYTPPELANKITIRTIKEMIDENKIDYDKLRGLKILDPSCGSGEFLVASAEKLYRIILKEYTNHSCFKDSIEIKNHILKKSIFGFDINPNAVKISILRLICWKYLNEIKSCKEKHNEIRKRIKIELKKTQININLKNFFDNFKIETDIKSLQKYDLIIGNPPFNIKLDNIVKRSIKRFIDRPIHNSAAYFLIFSYQLLKNNGICSLILPKSLSYSRGWNSIKNFCLKEIIILQDLSKAFQYVKLEQIVLYIKKNSNLATYISEDGIIEKAKPLNVSKLLCFDNKPLILGLNSVEFKLFQNIKKNLKVTLGDYIDAKRGLNIQKLAVPTKNYSKYIDIKKNDILFSIGGKEIKSFGLLEIPRCIKKNLIPKSILNKRLNCPDLQIIGQLANAHVKNPQPHFKLAFTLMENMIKNNFVTFDTVINISIKNHSPVHPKSNDFYYYFILGYLNSYIFAWYLYKIVYSSAIRSTRLDEIYLSQVPINPIFENYEENLELLTVIEAIIKGLILCEQILLHKTNSNEINNLNSKKKLLKNYLNHLYFIIHINPQDLLENFEINSENMESLKEFISNWNNLHKKSILTNLPKNYMEKEEQKAYFSRIIESRLIDNLVSLIMNIFLVKNLSEQLFNIQKLESYSIIFDPFRKKRSKMNNI